jgi:hypothetical protein
MINQLLDKATPLALSLFLSVIGVVAVLITEASNIVNAADPNKRKELAQRLILSSLPPNLCLGALSFDIWAITTLFANDHTAISSYNLSGKSNSILLVLVAHLMLYQGVLAWGGVVRGRAAESASKRFILEITLSVFAVMLCIIFQVY